MPDDVREYLRAAQQAEVKGDKPRAVELLEKAARLYTAAGNPTRALSVLRHARRLDDGARPELDEQVKRLEWLPDDPLSRAISQDVDKEEDVALASLDALGEEAKATRALVERGPQLADRSAQAWCSFCCRPRAEVGELVAGPAGAYVCGGCLDEAGRLLHRPARAVEELVPVLFDGPLPGASAEERPSPALAGVDLLGQAAAVAVVDRALRLSLAGVGLLGPAGSGKSTYLRELARRGLGRYVLAAELERLPEALDGQRLLVDDFERASPEERARCVKRLVAAGAPAFVLALRARPAGEALWIRGEEGELPVHSTRALVEASEGLLPEPLALRLQAVAWFQAPSAAELQEIARRLLAQRAAELDLSEELLEALAGEAARSPLCGHELSALLLRLPPGSWSLRPAPPAPKAAAASAPKKKRGKKSEAS